MVSTSVLMQTAMAGKKGGREGQRTAEFNLLPASVAWSQVRGDVQSVDGYSACEIGGGRTSKDRVEERRRRERGRGKSHCEVGVGQQKENRGHDE